MSDLSDQLEIDYGTVILEELTGETLTHKGQSVRLFDQTSRTSEKYYPEDGRGKPYIHNFKEGKRWYPITAYYEANGVDWQTALSELSARYLGDTKLRGKRSTTQRTRTPVVAAPPVSYHDPALVASTLGNYERNDFAVYLRRLFGVPVADELLTRFRVGTGDYWYVSERWPRAAIFWQIDEQQRVRAGKIIHYSSALGKRLKDKKTEAELRPCWVHEIRSMKDFHYEQCLFGLHQLPQKQPATKPIAIVESEKTVVIATAFEPGFIWLACGGLGNLTADKFKVLAGRNVTLFPDLKGFEQWNKKAVELRRVGCTVSVSRMLESKATVLERDAGSDIADFLTRHRCPNTGRVINEPDGYPALWDCEPMNNTPTIQEKYVQPI